MTVTIVLRGAVLSLLVASVGLLTVPGCTTVSPDMIEPTSVELTEAVHFTGHDGSDIIVEPGRYRLGKADDALRVTSEDDGGEILLRAEVATYEDTLTEPAAQLDSEGEDARWIVLFLPDGTSLEAAGSRSGIRSRGTSRWRRPTSRTRRSVARVVARPTTRVSRANPLTRGGSASSKTALSSYVKTKIKRETDAELRARRNEMDQLTRRLSAASRNITSAMRGARDYARYASAVQQAQSRLARYPTSASETRRRQDLRSILETTNLTRFPGVLAVANARADKNLLRSAVQSVTGKTLRPVSSASPNVLWTGAANERAPGGTSSKSDAPIPPDRFTLELKPPYSYLESNWSSTPTAYSSVLFWGSENNEPHLNGSVSGPSWIGGGCAQPSATLGEYFTVPSGYSKIRAEVRMQYKAQSVDPDSVGVIGGFMVMGSRYENVEFSLYRLAAPGVGPDGRHTEFVPAITDYRVAIPFPTLMLVGVFVDGLWTPATLWSEDLDVPSSGGEHMVVVAPRAGYCAVGFAAHTHGEFKVKVEGIYIHGYK